MGFDRDRKKPDAAVVLNHLHPRGDGGSLGGVEGGVNSVVEDAVGPVIARVALIKLRKTVRPMFT